MIKKLPNKVLFKIHKDGSDERRIEDIWIEKEYNPEGFELKENDTVIDIGAHIGIFTTYAAKLAKQGKVYSFEPCPENFILLEKNRKLNHLKNVKLFKYGIYKRKGKAKLFIDEKHNDSHSLYKEFQRFVLIKCITLKDIFDTNKITFCNFLKLDCEGAEYDILFNTPGTYFDKIDKIVLEYHDSIYKKKRWYHIVNFLTEKRFKVRIKTSSSYQGILYAKNTRKRNLVILKFENYLKIYASITYIKLDRDLGLIGIFLKKHYPRLYPPLKKLKSRLKNEKS